MGDFQPFRFDDVFDYVVLDEKNEALAQFRGYESVELEEYWDKSSTNTDHPVPAANGAWNRKIRSKVKSFDVYAILYGESHAPGKGLPKNFQQLVDHVKKHKGIMHSGKIISYTDKVFLKTLEEEALKTFKVNMVTQEDHHKSYLEKRKRSK